MTDIRRQLDQVVANELAKTIIPVRTEKGILVGNILIQSEGSLKNILREGDCLYRHISLNSCAIKIANIMARTKSTAHSLADKIYGYDQEYSKWFVDSQLLLKSYYAAKQAKDFDRADMLWARYIESKNRALSAKKSAEGLTYF